MADKIHYGIDNPHPLFNRKTELVWDGKYDEYGRRREVDIAGCAMPLQKIEMIDEPLSRASAEGTMELFAKQSRRLDDARNRLTLGRQQAGHGQSAGRVQRQGRSHLHRPAVRSPARQPPLFPSAASVSADFTMDVPLGDGKETVGKDQSTLEMVAYRDMWGKGTDSYLHMMYERLLLMKELPISRRYATWRVSGRGKPALKRGPIVGAPLSRLLSLGERGASKAASAANDRSPAIHRRDLKKETTSSRSDG